ncbi:MAG: ribonuclease P protein component [Patescibacteria group bacterium]
MLGRSFRIRKQEDFERVFRGGRPLFFDDLGCKFLFVGGDALRVGFSFSKKHIPLAVLRHRLRRRFSAALALQKENWPKGYDLVFFTVKKPKDVNYATIERITEHCISAINTVNKGK